MFTGHGGPQKVLGGGWAKITDGGADGGSGNDGGIGTFKF